MSKRFRSFLSLVLTAALCVALATPAAGAFAAGPPAGSPGLSLGRELSGEEAIRVLGADLAKVAAAHGKTAAALATALRSDKRLFVDPSGSLFYREAPAGLPLGAPLPTDSSGAIAAAGGADAFALHSKPDSKRVIYLDFDGHRLSGTAWNSYNKGADIIAPAWDIEGGSTVFTDTERTLIAQVWTRVAEDYAPFDVDVTTAYPGEDKISRSSTSDEYYGMRALISPISSYFGNYGGIAYVGAFDYTGDYYKPALVFSENLLNSEKYIAEACSHEVGHTLGLLHDGVTGGATYYAGHGTGETAWAPIMGNGYYRNVTQWSRGEYVGANNMEDDLAIIQSNGLAYRTDDHSNTAAGATTLAASSSFTASGFIGRAGDVDALSVSVGAGRLAVQVAPIARGPNLDIALELRDAAGALFASAQPFATLGANIDVIVPAGIYTLSIKGVGAGTPATGYSDYASFGQWKLTGTAVPGDSTTPQPVAPIASFTLSSTHGTAPLAVVFDGSSSTDSDGTIASYAWSFGDGTLATGVTASHAYTTAGTYTTSLTVTDSQGLTATTARQVVVSAPNVAPVARVTATPVSGTAPLTVAFSGSGSADADGSIVSYAWSFGDGVSATGLAVSHTYTKPGTYTARLTVTDNASATASASTQIVVSPAVTDTLRVAAITMIVVPLKADRYVQARVVVLDAGGQPVSGATVKGAWAGIVTGTSTGMTGADGSVLLSSKRTRKSGTITFTVTSVAKTAYTYASDENEVTLASLALPPTVK